MIIVQVGSNRGDTDNDPVYKLISSLDNLEDIKLILIEPHPKAKKFLEETYNKINDKIILNCAVGSYSGVCKFYTNNEWEDHVSQHSSLNRQHLIEHNHADSSITEYYIPILTLQSILDGLDIKEIDYLQVDTEGHDREILTNFPFEKYKIKKLQFEIAHWDAPHKNNTGNNFIENLKSKGWTFSDKTEIDVILTNDGDI